MFFKGEYIKDKDITRMEYVERNGKAVIYRAHGALTGQERYISCTRNEYEIEAMHLERRMERR